MQNISTQNNLIISDSIDSIAKLNIMTDVKSVFEDNIPQIMLSQTKSGYYKDWDGDRLAIKYTSGNEGSYFSLSEITGNYRQRINFEFLGSNNLFHTIVSGTYGNSFIYSQNNILSDKNSNCNFIHSDDNEIYASASQELNFIHSNDNYIQNTWVHGGIASAKNLSFYNSNNNCIHPAAFYIEKDNYEYDVFSGSYLQNNTLIGSNYNYLTGCNICYVNSDNIPNYTLINTNKSYISNNIELDSLTLIGNTLSYFNTSGNLIGIGEGLIQSGGNSDKIILGFYNQNTTDPDEILVVGDGRANKDYINDRIENWASTAYSRNWPILLGKLSGSSDNYLTAPIYRHNIFTVNKNGYITISDYKKYSNSARYGYDGISAYINGEEYKIPFDKLYHKLSDEDDEVLVLNEKIDSLQKEVEEFNENSQSYIIKDFTDPENLLDTDTQLSGYLNLEKPNDSKSIKIIDEKLKNNTIINITYQPDIITYTNRRIPAMLIWSYYLPKGNGQSILQHANTLIYPYCTKQFIFQSPDYPTDDNSAKPFSGMTLVDNDNETNYIGYTSNVPNIKYFVSKIEDNITYYCQIDYDWAILPNNTTLAEWETLKLFDTADEAIDFISTNDYKLEYIVK